MIEIKNKVARSTEGLPIRRRGAAGPGHSSAAPVTDASLYEEVTPEMLREEEARAARSEAEEAYGRRVEELIRLRYPLRDELAALRQRDTKPGEFAAYDEYAERCKALAREEAGNDLKTEER